MQLSALRKAGCRRLVQETASGAFRRPALEHLLARLRRGDQLVVYKVDRLARTMRGLLDVQDSLRQAGATLRSLTEPIDTSTPIGEAFFQLLGVFAQLERSMIRERCEEGRRAAVARGVVLGKPRSFDFQRAAELRALRLTYAEIGRRLGAHPTTIRTSLARLAKQSQAVET